MVILEMLWMWSSFYKPGVCHECSRQLPALPVLQQGCHVVSHHPYQEMQRLALLCFKAMSFSLSLNNTLQRSFPTSNFCRPKVVFLA